MDDLLRDNHKRIFVNLKSNSALFYNKGHNFWKSVLTFKIPRTYRDLYTNENWFVILLSRVYFAVWVTQIRQFSPLKTNNRAQLRTISQ